MANVCLGIADGRFVGAADVRERQATRATRLEVKETIMIDAWCLEAKSGDS